LREFLLHIVSKNIFHYDFPYIFHFMLFLLFRLVFYFYRWNWILRNSRTMPWFSAAAAKGTKTRLYKYIASMLKSSLRRCFGRHHEMVDRFEISISQMPIYLFISMRSYFFFHLSWTKLLPDLAMTNTCTFVCRSLNCFQLLLHLKIVMYFRD
jgi:hypothetical protein